jgi:hypothetical protein
VGLQDRLVGTYELVSLEARRSDGDVARPLGERAVGLFVFDRNGRFSVQLMDPDVHPKRTAYVAMFGTYVVDDARQTFTLTPTGALDPALVGARVLRHVELTDDLAVFHTEPLEHDGLVTTTYITWRPVAGS